MDLEAYRARRDFRRTQEPRAERGPRSAAPRFVVQEHHARRLHYDFRLEMGGVLKSWAVPKGPSLNPSDKRLAVMTEDHPVRYLDFQGHIAKGNYGAGDMAIWDSGCYEVDSGDAERDVRQGKLVVRLNGRKLRGEFHLVRMRGEDNQWLMLKGRDQYANPSWKLMPVLGESAVSAAGGPSGGGTAKTRRRSAPIASKPVPPFALTTLSRVRPAPMPDQVAPMLATLTEAVPESDSYLYELKWDGFRAVCFLRNGTARLVSRNHNDLSRLFPELIAAVASLPVSEAVFDGEIVALDSRGRPSFQLLQNRTGIKSRERQQQPPAPVAYCLFDLLYQDGYDLTQCRLDERRQRLAMLLRQAPAPCLHLSESVQGAGAGQRLLEEARRHGLEGIIAKDIRSPYLTTRSSKWLKLKIGMRQEVVIGGYTAPRRSRQHFGALVVGLYEGGQLQYVGHVGGGFDARGLKYLRDKMQPLKTARCPFAVPPRTNEPVQWIKPRLVCEVKFAEWTAEGNMRQPIFLGLRDDKEPRQCRRETPVGPTAGRDPVLPVKAAKPKAAQPDAAKPDADTSVPDVAEVMAGSLHGDQSVRVGEQVLQLTHLDKVYWPDDGYTKGDLLRYYYQVAATILPHLRGRPLILQRYPNGIDGKPFFQHNVERPPEFLRTWAIQEDRSTVRYAVCDDLASLLYLVNLGTIAQHPWHSRTGKLEHPDWIVFDLDPENLDWKAVCAVAVSLHRVLDQIGLAAYAKTSGSSGLHVYVPLQPLYSYEQGQGLARLVASLVQAQHPDVVTLERVRARRGASHLYLDCVQNEQGKSVVSPYSVRAKPGATVSAPLSWAEVRRAVSIYAFNLTNMPQRLRRRGDLFDAVLHQPQRIEAAVQRLEALLAAVPR